MATAKQSPKPVFVRVRVEISDHEYFSYKSKKGDAGIGISVLEEQLKELDISQLVQGMLPVATLKYEACVPEEED